MKTIGTWVLVGAALGMPSVGISQTPTGASLASKPCWATYVCKPDKGTGLSSLQTAWDSSATTTDQKQKMLTIITGATLEGVTDWTKASADYFAWRAANQPRALPYVYKPQPSPSGSNVVVASDTPSCANLRQDYENASKKLALSKADGTFDDSAPRAAMRAAQDTATISQAQVELELMRFNTCKLPTFAPSAERYGLASLRCATAKEAVRAQESMSRLSGRYAAYETPSACNIEFWQPDHP